MANSQQYDQCRGYQEMKESVPDETKIDHFLTFIFQSGYRTRAVPFRRLGFTILHPMVAWAAFQHLRRLPVVKVTISSSDRGKALWMYDSRRPWRLHGLVTSYLEIPSPLSIYWRGSSRHNLRTHTAHAKAEGYQVELVNSPAINGVIAQVTSDKGWRVIPVESALLRVGGTLDDAICVGVFDSNQRAVAFHVGVQAGNVLRNVWSYSSQRGSARWLCFSGFIEHASDKGVRFIIEAPPWALTGGNKVFMRRLGFTPARVRCQRN